MVVYYGRRVTGAEADSGLVSDGGMRACVFDPPGQHLWVYRMGIWAWKTSGAPTARLAAYDTDGSNNPDTRLGYTSLMNITSVAPGNNHEANVGLADNAPTNDAFKVYSSHHTAICIHVDTGDIGHSMAEALDITADNEQFYDRTGVALPPPSSFGAYSASIEGHMSAWMFADANVDPETPSTGLYPTGSVSETSPTFTANFRDQNGTYGTDRGDRLKKYKIQVRRVSDQVSFWDSSTYTASSAEVTAEAISRAYAGTALVRGTAYEWRVKMSDQFDAWSSYSAWTTFTPANLGFVTLNGNPTSKVETNQHSFEGRWNHQSATAMTKAKIRLYDENGTLLQSSGEITKAAASSALPGTLFTLTWADTGFTTLDWGADYQYEIAGYDGAQWSDWSAKRSFSTNAAPSVPSSLSPSGGTTYTSISGMKLTCSFTDADDTTATGLTGTARITRPDASTTDVTLTYNATTGLWEYTLTVAELNQYGTFSWKATGYDGTLYSGEATVLGSATWSASSSFIYASGPVVAVSSPTNGSTLTGSSLTVNWSVSSGGPQTKYRIYLYDDNTATLAYDSGWVVSTAVTAVIPSGNYLNGQNYDLVVGIENNLAVQGWSSIVNLLVSYTDPSDVTGAVATPIKVTRDPWETAIRVSFDQTTYAVGGSPSFSGYIIDREVGGETVRLAEITSPTQNWFIDYTPPSGLECTYTIYTEVQQGLDTLVSVGVAVEAQVDLGNTVLCSAQNGGTYRVVLRNVKRRGFDLESNKVGYLPLDGGPPTFIDAGNYYWTGTLEAQLIDDTWSTALQKYSDLEDLARYGGTICNRDNVTGRKIFMEIVDGPRIEDQVPGWFLVTLGVSECRYTEGA